MKDFVKRMIDEHKALSKKTIALHVFVHSKASEDVSKIDFANMCIQLKGMKMYLAALEARLKNQGIIIEGNQYFEKVVADEPIGTDEDDDK